ncbi:cytochrome P450 [Actinomadura sp. 6K520]|jgi:cytochrome P450|uniref:cytochrome P450 n=1 Tax=Actinomadura sp. 6K520 TaxID=2530364 RepID=UPI00104E0A0B|nr:cytochrome P450 [Actinomadura sp. 6K520]TDE26618.1 cytochrome P450 [Actinomadura sp. 6K520]
MTQQDEGIFSARPDGSPPPEFAERRKESPLAPVTMPSGDEAVLAVRYKDVHAVLTSPAFSREALLAPEAPRILPGEEFGEDPNALTNMDPPRHTRVRRILSDIFSPRHVKTWHPKIVAITERLAGDLLAAGPPADLVAAFTLPLPIQIMCELLGVPAGDRERFRTWTDMIISSTAFTAEERVAAAVEFSGYVRDLIERRRDREGDALVDALISAHDEGERLSEAELVHLTVMLIMAGYETTASVLARGVLSLLTTDQYRVLRDEPEIIPTAVEEVLRFGMPGDGGLLRMATKDVELPSGTVRAGQAVMPSMASANRDPEVFTDPERFDVRREHCPHLTFGQGAHYCAGANLARHELQVALETLTRMVPGLRLDVAPEEVEWRSGLLLRAPLSLPVAW